MNELLLGIDIGTSSTKGVLARPDGTIVATAQRAHAVSLPRPGWVEHDADRIWWNDFLAICAELVPEARGRIAAVCASGMGPCVLVVDAAGEPLRPAILYGVDTRATREIAELTERYGAERILAQCGSPLSTQAVGPKLAWLRRNEPAVWSSTRRVLLASSFIVERLTGEYVLDHHTASQCAPLYDIGERQWIEYRAQEIAPGLELPRLLWPFDVAGRVTARAAELTGLAVGTPVATGTIDARADAISVGVGRPGDVMLQYGTTAYLMAVLDRPRPHPHLWCNVGVAPGTYTLGAGMATAGALTGWLQRIVGDAPYEALVAEAARVGPGSDSLVVLPYFAGERSPLFDPRARGLICGLTLSHGRGHLYRALLEGIGYGVRHNMETMLETGAEIKRLVAVGGGTKGGLWTQIVSDVTGQAQQIPAITIGASYGDALLAGVAAGLCDLATYWNSTSRILQPNAPAHALYNELYTIYRSLYPATQAHMHELAEMQMKD